LIDSTDSSIIFATGESVQVCFDYQKNASMPVSDELRAHLSGYLKE
jgi:acyl-CoA thioesterase FadM